jgi:cysteine desulfurase/selenocysteine lyase
VRIGRLARAHIKSWDDAQRQPANPGKVALRKEDVAEPAMKRIVSGVVPLRAGTASMTNDVASQNQAPLYFANAAAGIMLPEVVEATINHLRREATIGALAAFNEVSDTLSHAYLAGAELIGAEVEEVAFLESGNRALAALIQSAGLKPGDHVLVDRTCWGGTLDMLSSYHDVVVDVMPVDGHGRVDVDAARSQAHPATKLLVLTWCPATCGFLNPAEEVGALAAELGAFYIVDACQVVGQRPVSVRRLRCHGLATSGRKWLRGPRGTALLYASRAYLAATQPFMPDQFGRGRADARRYETGEFDVAARVGLSVALRTATTLGVEATARQLAETATTLRNRLSALQGTSIVEQGPDLAGFVTLTVDGLDAAKIAAELMGYGVSVSSPGRVYTPFDMDARGITSVLRIAPHLFTTSADVDALTEALGRVALYSTS